ncbi:MAG: ATP-binding protein [Dissulfurispiraceae bacterium]
MGHISNPEKPYRILQQRLDQKVQGAPASPTFLKILRVLFSPAEAELVCQLPHNFTSLETLSNNLGIHKDELDSKLSEMAQRGLVFDIEHNGRRYFTLNPVVIGFFEMTFMRIRPDMPMKELSDLFEKYFYENDSFARTHFHGRTQLTRSLVREEAIPGIDHTEILDWERATHIISSASSISVGLCQCHHTAQHLGQACDRPAETCLTFNIAAESLSRNRIARSITKTEAMNILGKCKEAGLAQTGDNVQRKVTFICNCCGCCCHVMRALKTFELHPGIVTSNWIMNIDLSKCKGCGECAKVCPAGAIRIDTKKEGDMTKKWAVLSEDACLGCGVCSTKCKFGAATMKSRPQRVIVPETVFDQRVAMAIERGKLSDLLFDDPGKFSHRAMARVVRLIERSPLFKAAMARESIKSSFLNTIVKEATKKAGDLATLVT